MTTKVRSAHQITLLTGNPATRATLRVEGSRLTSGDVIVSPPSPRFPDGVLVKVDQATRRDGATVLSTNPATLTDAIPSGVIHKSITAEFSLAQSRRRGLVAHAAGEDESTSLLQSIKCSAKGSASITGNLTAKLELKLDSGWYPAEFDWADSELPAPWLETSAAGSAHGDLTAKVEGIGECTLDRTALLEDPIELPKIGFSLYGVPVWLDNSLQFYLEGHAEASANVQTSAAVDVSSDAGARISPRHDPQLWFNPPKPQFTFNPPSASVEGYAEIWLGFDVESMLYGQVGGAAGLDLGPRLDAGFANRAPWWKLVLQARGTARVRSDIPGLEGEHAWPEILKHTWDLAGSKPPNPIPEGVTYLPRKYRGRIQFDGFKITRIGDVVTWTHMPSSGTLTCFKGRYDGGYLVGTGAERIPGRYEIRERRDRVDINGNVWKFNEAQHEFVPVSRESWGTAPYFEQYEPSCLAAIP